MRNCKKILSVFALILLLVGCGSSAKMNDDAIKAYVDKTNSLADDSIKFDMDAKLSVPKSALVNTELDMAFDGKGLIDFKNTMMEFDFNMIENQTNKKVNMKMLIDKEFMYMNMEGEWVKMPLDAQTKKDLDFGEISKEKLTVEDAKEQFEKDKNIKFDEKKVDGNDAYVIGTTLKLDELINAAKKEKTADSEEVAQALEMLKDMDMSVDIIVFKDEKLPLRFDIKMNMDIMGTKINLDPLKLELNGSKDKVVIPAAAKKAKEIENSSTSGMINGV